MLGKTDSKLFLTNFETGMRACATSASFKLKKAEVLMFPLNMTLNSKTEA